MIDLTTLKKARTEIAAVRQALTAARDDLQLTHATMDAPEAVATLQADYRATRKLQARLETERAARPKKDAALSQAKALAALRDELADRSLAALTARVVPPVPAFNRRELLDGLPDYQVEGFRERHASRQQMADLQDTLAKLTFTMRVPHADPATLGHLTEHAAATDNLWLLGLIADTARARPEKAFAPVRDRAREAMDAIPLPPAQAEALDALDAIAADAQVIERVYQQLAVGDVDDVGTITTPEFAERVTALEAEGPGAGARYALGQMERRRTRNREASERAVAEVRRVASAKPAEPAPVSTEGEETPAA